MKQNTETLETHSRKRWLVLGSVLTSRIIYTINWFNIAPLLGATGLIALGLSIDLPSQGLLTSSFLLGAGIFQIPAGIVSARWGPKNTSQLGMLILSLSGIGEGLSPNFPVLLVSRFLLGLGAALFFAPAIGILTPLFRQEEEGLVLGLYNSCFNIGGAIGLFSWVLVTGMLGSLGIILFGVSQPLELWFLIPLVGFLDAIVFSTMYASPSQYPEVGHEYAPLGISIINSVQILGSFPIPIVFTFLVNTYGQNYTPGWFFMGGLALALMLLILGIREPFKANSNASS